MLYSEAQTRYTQTRKRLGRVSVGQRIKLEYHEPNDTYRLGREIVFEHIDGKWVNIPEKERKLNVFAEISRTETRFTIQHLPDKYQLRSLGLDVAELHNAKVIGHQFWYMGKNVAGNFPIVLTTNGVACSPLLYRKENPDKRKELNTKIKEIRRLLRTRAKLGAFNHIVSKQEVINHAIQTGVLKLLPAINFVKNDDITSFYPLIALCYSYWYIKELNFETKLVPYFNSLIRRNKESMLRECGAIVYE